MKLKCIGGPNDGEWHDVAEFRMHDMQRIIKKQDYTTATFTPIDQYQQIPELAQINWIEYIMDIAAYRTDGTYIHKFKYLRWAELTRDAIMIKLLTDAFL